MRRGKLSFIGHRGGRQATTRHDGDTMAKVPISRVARRPIVKNWKHEDLPLMVMEEIRTQRDGEYQAQGAMGDYRAEVVMGGGAYVCAWMLASGISSTDTSRTVPV